MKYRITALLLSIFLIAFFLHAQNVKEAGSKPKPTSKKLKDYKQAWQEIDSLAKLDLPKTSLPLLQEIYAKAKAENNAPEQIKAMLHIVRTQNILEENGIE